MAPSAATTRRQQIAALSNEPSPEDSARFVFTPYFKPLLLSEPIAESDRDRIDSLQALLKSTIGYLLFDRTRIRSVGWTIGERLYALSLAPSEEVVVEQKSFSKRETTFEEQNERDEQMDLERSSTLTTELAEGLDRELAKNDQTSFGFGASGSAGSESGLGVKAEASYSRTLSEASKQASKESVREMTSVSARLAAKYRAVHRTTFRVSAEDRFESNAKRTLRNPSRFGALQLRYYKMLEQVELTQERYGARLAWASTIKDPGGDLRERVRQGKASILQDATRRVDATLASRPRPPVPPDRPPRTEVSNVTEADRYEMNGGMGYDYDVPITMPDGYRWDGDVGKIMALSSAWGRPADAMWWEIRGTPWVDSRKLMVKLHIGAKGWLGGPKIYYQVKAGFVADSSVDPTYQQAMRKWEDDVARWDADRQKKLEEVEQTAARAADEWETQFLNRVDPLSELMQQIAKANWLGSMADEAWEVDFWSHVFDWRWAGVTLFPGWWSKEPAADSLRPADHFLNASWAKFYLPVKPGFERVALRWIVGNTRDAVLDSATEAAIDRIVEELRAYRLASFGDVEESGPESDEIRGPGKYLTLGRCLELLPTDGTYLEVVMGSSTAIDEPTRAELEDVARERQVRITADEQDVALKAKAIETIGGTKPTVSVLIGTESTGDGSGH